VDVHVTVKLADLKRAVRRLTVRLADESPLGEGFVTLRVALNRLTTETVNSAEELTADVHQAGTANVRLRCSVPSRRLSAITVAGESSSASRSANICANRTVTRHPGIRVN
jgi:hypothetical protein